MKSQIFVLCLSLPLSSWAGVYKCTDAAGNSHYQSSPCTEETKAVQINTTTGSKTDLTELENQKTLETEQQKQQASEKQAEEQAKLEAIAQRNQNAQQEHALTQALIKQNPNQFSAFAIPPYVPEQLPNSVKPFEMRLPEIERFRRLAAQKALASGKCQRVEADELNAKSTKEQLVFLINCSSGVTFYFKESELSQ